MAIDLQGLARSGIFTWLANAGLSVGLDNAREGAREGARLSYDLWRRVAATARTRWTATLSVLPLLGVPVHERFQWLPERPRRGGAGAGEMAAWIGALDYAAARRALGQQRWPVEHFKELARAAARTRAGLEARRSGQPG